MSEHVSRISRRSLLRGGLAAAAVAAGLPLTSCTTGEDHTSATNSTAPTSPSTGRPSGTGIANVHVSDDQYGFHVEPSVAVNPRHPRQLLVACQAAATARDYRYGPRPAFIATYFSFDGGETWHNGARPQPPVGQAPPSDDVTVAFDPHGRGYLLASRASNTPGGRVIFVYRTDDGGRSFSAPVTLSARQYSDHPGIAAGAGQTSSQRNVYVIWAAQASDGSPALAFTRSTDGAQTFQSARHILTDSRPSDGSAGGKLVTSAHGLVCAVCNVAVQQSSGDTIGRVMAVCSTDFGQSFAAAVELGTEALDIGLPGDVKAKSDSAVAAAPHGDALYVGYTTHQPGTTPSDIVVTASHDKGRTWSQPVKTTPADGVTYFQPNLAVDEAGRLAISAFALDGGRVDEVLLVSTPGQLSFSQPLRVTTTAFDPRRGSIGSSQKEGAWWIGDYQGITAGAGAFHLVWSDTRTGNLDLFAATVHP
jgi:BNR/Asp-box repeat